MSGLIKCPKCKGEKFQVGMFICRFVIYCTPSKM